MKNAYQKIIYLFEYLLWAIGGCIYYGIEVISVDFHIWSMFLLGGICMMFFTYQGRTGQTGRMLCQDRLRLYDLCCEYGIYHRYHCK